MRADETGHVLYDPEDFDSCLPAEVDLLPDVQKRDLLVNEKK